MVSSVKLANIRKYMNVQNDLTDIRPASDWSDEVIEMIMNPNQDQEGVPIPYNDYQDHLRFRVGEVSIWAGVNGHGKSLILNQFVLVGIFAEKFGIISPEMTPKRQLQRLTYQGCRSRHANPEQMKAFHDFTNGRLWLYDQQGAIQPAVLYACIRYMAGELDIKHVIIDSMMKCIQKEDDMNEQKAFVNQLTNLAKELGIHIHLVCHSRKGQSEGAMPDKFNIKGSGAITDLVDNVLLVWRNKDKEKKLSSQKISHQDRIAIEADPDAGLICVKQRHHDWEGSIWLNYHSPSMLLLNNQQAPSQINWVELLEAQKKESAQNESKLRAV